MTLNLYDLDQMMILLSQTKSEDILLATRKVFDTINLPERGPQGSPVNERCIDIFTKALIQELRNIVFK